MLPPEDDRIHPIGEEPWWREAWYWGFYDHHTGVHVMCYLGVFPNQRRADVTIGVYRGAEVLDFLMKMDYSIPRDIGEDRLAFGPVIMNILRPMQEWTVNYASPSLDFGVRFQAVHPPYSWAESRLWMESEKQPGASSKHFDQVGRFTGELRYGGQTLSIDVLGFRDRMWGWGGRSKWKQYIMLWPVFGEDLVINVYPQGFTDGREQLCGYIFQDGQRDLLRYSAFHVDWKGPGRIPRQVLCDIESLAGKQLRLQVEPINIIDTSGVWPHRSGHLLFGMARYDVAGRTGFGELAYCYQTEAERPVDWTVRQD
jgi:hypothetical protein